VSAEVWSDTSMTMELCRERIQSSFLSNGYVELSIERLCPEVVLGTHVPTRWRARPCSHPHCRSKRTQGTRRGRGDSGPLNVAVGHSR
jgi:hypothetical protein